MTRSQTPNDVSLTTWLANWFSPEGESDNAEGPAEYECVLCGTAYRRAISECESCGGDIFAR